MHSSSRATVHELTYFSSQETDSQQKEGESSLMKYRFFCQQTRMRLYVLLSATESDTKAPQRGEREKGGERVNTPSWNVQET